MRQKIKRTMVYTEENDKNWPPQSLQSMIYWLEHKKQAITEQERETATVIISSGGGYNGDHYAIIEISYERLETDEEVLLREKLSKSQKDKDLLTIRNLERTLFELKKKYEEDDSDD